MDFANWISVNFLDPDEFYEFLQTLPEEHQALELKNYSKRLAKKILKEEMKTCECFYDFMEIYSRRDFKIIKGEKYVSQRVVSKHVKYWNITHPEKRIKTLRIFYM
jgi:hypothetical protein